MLRRFLVFASFALLAPATALAAGSAFQTWGPHIGFSSDPNQVVFGGHLEMGEIAPQVDFVPGVDVGFGDHATLVAISGDFRYRLKVSNVTWQPYVGGGVALHFYSWNSDYFPPGTHHSETLGGGELIGGADVPTRTGSRFFVEGRFGLADAPSFKALAGWCFPMR
jgi:hypothetical protein